MSGEVAQDTDCCLDAFGDSVMLWSPSVAAPSFATHPNCISPWWTRTGQSDNFPSGIPGLCLSRLSSSPSLAGRRQTEPPDYPWSRGATEVTEAVTGSGDLFCLHGQPRRRSRPRAPMGPSQPRRPGPLHPSHDHTARQERGSMSMNAGLR